MHVQLSGCPMAAKILQVERTVRVQTINQLYLQECRMLAVGTIELVHLLNPSKIIYIVVQTENISASLFYNILIAFN